MVVAKVATTTKHGAKIQVHEINVYNLDVIISVGYRVKSQRGVEFRLWANKIAMATNVSPQLCEEKDVMVKVVVNLINRDN